jgi:hypothetical protein
MIREQDLIKKRYDDGKLYLFDVCAKKAYVGSTYLGYNLPTAKSAHGEDGLTGVVMQSCHRCLQGLVLGISGR